MEKIRDKNSNERSNHCKLIHNLLVAQIITQRTE